MKNPKRTLLLFATVFMTTVMAYSQVITAEHAQSIAERFFAQGAMITRGAVPELEKAWDSSLIAEVEQTRGAVADAPTFYAFSGVAGKGFVIVAGEETGTNIIGYSVDGKLPSVDNIPEGMIDYLADIDKQVRAVRAGGNIVATRAATAETEYGTPVVYLETAEWGQGAPFNKLCFTAGGASAVTGCVPTAYAILMHYYKWPVAAEETKVYHSGTGESMILGHAYDWDNMLSDYSGTYTDAQATAVATLMRDLGWAYQVAYGTGGTDSGAGGENAQKLTEIFKYKCESPQTTGAGFATGQDIVGEANFKKYIKESLDANHPIPFSAYNSQSGGRHIFICDGYTENDYYHFNWGWGGNGNGYFTLNNMAVDATSDYTSSHRAYFMLMPDKEDVEVMVTVTATSSNEAAGSATVNGEASVSVADGSQVTLVATANNGYLFTNWTLNGEVVSTESTFVTQLNGATDYVANFVEMPEAGKFVDYELSEYTGVFTAADGTVVTNGYSSKYTFKVTDDNPAQVVLVSIQNGEEANLIHSSSFTFTSARESVYTISVPSPYKIWSYGFDVENVDVAYGITPTITAGAYSVTLDRSNAKASFGVEEIADASTSFTITNGDDYNYLNISNFVVKVYIPSDDSEDGGGETAIDGVAEDNAMKGIYDLTGRRIEKITVPGVYIIDGKKKLIK